MQATYPVGFVRALIDTDAVTTSTRAALEARLSTPVVTVPRFFTALEFAVLQAVCARLLPGLRIDIAGEIDARLAADIGDGWRYEVLPPDRRAYQVGLAGVEQAAQGIFGRGFRVLTSDEQGTVLTAVQTNTAPGVAWQTVPAIRFFEELLAEATEIYFAHPLAQEAIGYAGMADAPGWERIGLDERDDREPQAHS